MVLGATVLGCALAAALLRGTSEREAAPPPPVTEPMLVGFLDDVSFRWHASRAQLLDRAQATGARLIRAFIRWHLAAPERPAQGAPPFDEPRLYELDELVASAQARGMEVLRVAVASPEAPGDLIERADLVVDGPRAVLDLLRQLASDAPAPQPAREYPGAS